MFSAYNFKNSQLFFIGWQRDHKNWVQLYCENPCSSEFDLTFTTGFRFYDKSWFDADHRILNIRQFGFGERLFACDFMADGTLSLTAAGQLRHGDVLDENWIFSFEDKQKSNSKHSVYFDLCAEHYLSSENDKLHVYYTPDNKIKTLKWQRNDEGILQPTVVHSNSFSLEEDF